MREQPRTQPIRQQTRHGGQQAVDENRIERIGPEEPVDGRDDRKVLHAKERVGKLDACGPGVDKLTRKVMVRPAVHREIPEPVRRLQGSKEGPSTARGRKQDDPHGDPRPVGEQRDATHGRVRRQATRHPPDERGPETDEQRDLPKQRERHGHDRLPRAARSAAMSVGALTSSEYRSSTVCRPARPRRSRSPSSTSSRRSRSTQASSVEAK